MFTPLTTEEHDQRVKSIFANQSNLEEWMEIKNSELNGSGAKQYQLIIFYDSNLGIIYNRKASTVMAVFSVPTELFGRFLGRCQVCTKKVGGFSGEEYFSYQIQYYMPKVTVHGQGMRKRKSLAKLIMMATDNSHIPEKHSVHHVQHSAISTLDQMQIVTIGENSKTRPKLDTFESALNYIKKEVVKTDDSGWKILIKNLQEISKLHPTKRAIYVKHPVILYRPFDFDVLEIKHS